MENLGGLSQEIGSIFEERESKTQKILQSVAAAVGVAGVTLYFLQAYTGKLTSEHFATVAAFNQRNFLFKRNFEKLTPQQVNDKLITNINQALNNDKELVDKIIASAEQTVGTVGDEIDNKNNILRKLIQLASDSTGEVQETKATAEIAKAITLGGADSVESADAIFKVLVSLDTTGAYTEEGLSALAKDIFIESRKLNQVVPKGKYDTVSILDSESILGNLLSTEADLYGFNSKVNIAPFKFGRRLGTRIANHFNAKDAAKTIHLSDEGSKILGALMDPGSRYPLTSTTITRTWTGAFGSPDLEQNLIRRIFGGISDSGNDVPGLLQEIGLTGSPSDSSRSLYVGGDLFQQGFKSRLERDIGDYVRASGKKGDSRQVGWALGNFIEALVEEAAGGKGNPLSSEFVNRIIRSHSQPFEFASGSYSKRTAELAIPGTRYPGKLNFTNFVKALERGALSQERPDSYLAVDLGVLIDEIIGNRKVSFLDKDSGGIRLNSQLDSNHRRALKEALGDSGQGALVFKTATLENILQEDVINLNRVIELHQETLKELRRVKFNPDALERRTGRSDIMGALNNVIYDQDNLLTFSRNAPGKKSTSGVAMFNLNRKTIKELEQQLESEENIKTTRALILETDSGASRIFIGREKEGKIDFGLSALGDDPTISGEKITKLSYQVLELDPDNTDLHEKVANTKVHAEKIRAEILRSRKIKGSGSVLSNIEAMLREKNFLDDTQISFASSQDYIERSSATGITAGQLALIPLEAGSDARSRQQARILATEGITDIRKQIEFALDILEGRKGFIAFDTEFNTDPTSGRRMINELGYVGINANSDFTQEAFHYSNRTKKGLAQLTDNDLFAFIDKLDNKIVVSQTSVDLDVLEETLLQRLKANPIAFSSYEAALQKVKEAKGRFLDQSILIQATKSGSVSLDAIALSRGTYADLDRHTSLADVRFGLSYAQENREEIKRVLLNYNEADAKELQDRLYFAKDPNSRLYGEIFRIKNIQEFTSTNNPDVKDFRVDVLIRRDGRDYQQSIEFSRARKLRNFLTSSADNFDELMSMERGQAEEVIENIRSDRARRIKNQLNPLDLTFRDPSGTLGSGFEIKNRGLSFNTINTYNKQRIYDFLNEYVPGADNISVRDEIIGARAQERTLEENIAIAKDLARRYFTHNVEQPDLGDEINKVMQTMFVDQVALLSTDASYAKAFEASEAFYRSPFARAISGALLDQDRVTAQYTNIIAYTYAHHKYISDAGKIDIRLQNPRITLKAGSERVTKSFGERGFELSEAMLDLNAGVSAYALRDEYAAMDKLIKDFQEASANYTGDPDTAPRFTYDQKKFKNLVYLAKSLEKQELLLEKAKTKTSNLVPNVPESIQVAMENLANLNKLLNQENLSFSGPAEFQRGKEYIQRIIYGGSTQSLDQSREFLSALSENTNPISEALVEVLDGAPGAVSEWLENTLKKSETKAADFPAGSASRYVVNSHFAGKTSKEIEQMLYDVLQGTSNMDKDVTDLLERALKATTYVQSDNIDLFANLTDDQVQEALKVGRFLMENLEQHVLGIGAVEADAQQKAQQLLYRAYKIVHDEESAEDLGIVDDSPIRRFGTLLFGGDLAAPTEAVTASSEAVANQAVKQVHQAVQAAKPTVIEDTKEVITAAAKAVNQATTSPGSTFLETEREVIHRKMLQHISKVVPPLAAAGGVVALMAAHDPNKPNFSQGEVSDKIGTSVAKASEIPGEADAQRMWLGEETPFRLKISYKGFVRSKEEREYLLRETYNAINQRMEVTNQDSATIDDRTKSFGILARDILRDNI